MKRKIIIGVLLLFLVIGTVTAADRIQTVQTPTGTTCKLDIGSGLDASQTTVNEDGQKLVFDAGWYPGTFISTSKENAADVIQDIQATGKKCTADGVTWYHFADKELTNTWSVFGGTHLKLEDTNEFDVGFLENPNNDEVIILIAPSNRIVDCFKTIEWG